MKNKELENILQEKFFEKFNSSKGSYIENDSIRYLENWYFPKCFNDEIYMLFYLYDKRYMWATDVPTINNYIKRNIKDLSLKLMLNKIEENENLYFELKNFLEKRKKFNSRSSFDCISRSSIKYIYFALHRVLKNVPDYIKNTEKYNL